MANRHIGLLCIPFCAFAVLLSTCDLSAYTDDLADEGPPANSGTLLIRANIGPTSPVTIVGTPAPTPSPEVCTSRGLEIYEAAGGDLVERFKFNADCTYALELAPGSYEIRMPDDTIEYSKELPETVEVTEGETTEVEVVIDTGVR